MNKRNMETLLQYILVAADEIEESDAASGETTHDADALRSIAEDTGKAEALNSLLNNIKSTRNWKWHVQYNLCSSKVTHHPTMDDYSCEICLNFDAWIDANHIEAGDGWLTDPLTYLGQPQQPPASS